MFGNDTEVTLPSSLVLFPHARPWGRLRARVGHGGRGRLRGGSGHRGVGAAEGGAL